MASMLGVGSSSLFINLAGAPNPSFPLRSPALGPSRVFFPLTGKCTRSYKAKDSIKESAEEAASATDKLATDIQDKAVESVQEALEKAKEAVGANADKATEFKESVQEDVEKAKQKVKEAL